MRAFSSYVVFWFCLFGVLWNKTNSFDWITIIHLLFMSIQIQLLLSLLQHKPIPLEYNREKEIILLYDSLLLCIFLVLSHVCCEVCTCKFIHRIYFYIQESPVQHLYFPYGMLQHYMGQAEKSEYSIRLGCWICRYSLGFMGEPKEQWDVL